MATYMHESPITKTLCIKVTDAMQEWLKAVAKQEQRSMGHIVRELLTQGMNVLPVRYLPKEDAHAETASSVCPGLHDGTQ